jgi:hypothetical protein
VVSATHNIKLARSSPHFSLLTFQSLVRFSNGVCFAKSYSLAGLGSRGYS